jgi:hypothetical protein
MANPNRLAPFTRMHTDATAKKLPDLKKHARREVAMEQSKRVKQ